MFGYVRIRKPELLVKDYECYKGFYCGLCHSLRDTYGLRGQVTLTYDMTFLVLLLSSVYDLAVKEEHKRCIIHPAGKRRVIRTEAADYAADINMLLSYYHFVDDKQDEHSLAASLGVQMYRGQSRRLEQHYPRQARAIAEGMQRLHLLEQEDCRNVSALADCFGRMLAEVFAWKEDGLADFGKPDIIWANLSILWMLLRICRKTPIRRDSTLIWGLTVGNYYRRSRSSC